MQRNDENIELCVRSQTHTRTHMLIYSQIPNCMHPSGLSKRRARLHFSRTLGENTHQPSRRLRLRWNMLYGLVVHWRSMLSLFCLHSPLFRLSSVSSACRTYSVYWFVRSSSGSSSNTSLLSSLATNFSIHCPLFLSFSLHSLQSHCFCFIKCQFNMLPLHLDAGTQFTWAADAHEMEGKRKRIIVFQLQKGCKRTMLCLCVTQNEENWKAHRSCICLQKVQNINSILQCSMCILFSRIYRARWPNWGSFSLSGHQEKTRTHAHLHLHRPPILHFMLKCSSRFNGVFVQLYQNSIQRNCLLPDSRSHSLSLSLPLFAITISIYSFLPHVYFSIASHIYTQYLFRGTLKRLNSGVMRMRVQHYMARGRTSSCTISFFHSHLISPFDNIWFKNNKFTIFESSDSIGNSWMYDSCHTEFCGEVVRWLMLKLNLLHSKSEVSEDVKTNCTSGLPLGANTLQFYSLKMSCISLALLIFFVSPPFLSLCLGVREKRSQNPFQNITVEHMLTHIFHADDVKSLFIYSITIQWFRNRICHRIKWMGHFSKSRNNVTIYSTFTC